MYGNNIYLYISYHSILQISIENMMMWKIILRLDDVGASAKLFNQCGKIYWKRINKNIPISILFKILFIKKIPPFNQWGVYSELEVNKW